MDLSNNHGNETCWISEKVTPSYDNNDFISGLPDAILVRILSFLPIKDAINTILLRRFGDLWRQVQVLHLDSCLYHDCDCEDDEDYPDHLNENFVNVIRNVLNHHDGTLDKLCLKFHFPLSSKDPFSCGADNEWEKGTADQIEKLIRYSISRKVKVLDFNLKGCQSVFFPKELYDLPDVLSSNYLTYLKLTAFDIRSCKTIDLKLLSVLVLDELTLTNDVVEKVLLGCPLLEDLSLVDCYGLGKLICKNRNLKKVMLTLNPDEHWRVIISCPYVLSLEINGWIERAYLLEVSSVLDASIFFSYMFKCKQRKYVSLSRLLQKVSKLKTFSPCTWTIVVMTIWNFTNVRCPTFKWKNLTLKLSLTKWHHPGLSLLFRNCQSLETLTVYIYPDIVNIFRLAEAKWIEAYDFDGEKLWDSQEEATFPSLDSIMIYGYVNEPYVLQMVKFLLRSAPRLQKLVISTEEYFKRTRESWFFGGPINRQQFTSEKLQELSEKFTSLPRASPKATDDYAHVGRLLQMVSRYMRPVHVTFCG